MQSKPPSPPSRLCWCSSRGFRPNYFFGVSNLHESACSWGFSRPEQPKEVSRKAPGRGKLDPGPIQGGTRNPALGVICTNSCSFLPFSFLISSCHIAHAQRSFGKPVGCGRVLRDPPRTATCPTWSRLVWWVFASLDTTLRSVFSPV
jgi:hypothetical protein